MYNAMNSGLSPKTRYQSAIEAGSLLPDPRQADVVEHLEQLYQSLVTAPTSAVEKPGLFDRLFSRNKAPVQASPKGLYVWGGVGRGKTHLADLFFEALPFEQKLRLHYHRFMRRVHAELNRLGHVEDTIPKVAEILAADMRVLCLDEMHINDITDAMLMHGLLQALFDRGVVLVTTSNVPPSGLYRDGLQRERFLPAIELMEQRCTVVNLDSDTDYRLRTLVTAEIYHVPLDEAGERQLRTSFEQLAAPETRLPERRALEINHRTLQTKERADGVVWFVFPELCEGPRSKDDYIEIAKLCHTLLLSGVPQFDATMNDAARRFVNLIDELYDRNVKLIATAAAAADELYTGGSLSFEFERTASRLREMATEEYLALPHLP